MDNPSLVQQFKPISLWNVIPKAIYKIFSNRIRGKLKDFISPFQSTFILNRWISDNVIVSHKIIHTIKGEKGKGSLLGVKLDMEKAYDSME